MLIKIRLTFFLQKNVPDWALPQCISIMVIKIILTFFYKKMYQYNALKEKEAPLPLMLKKSEDCY